MQANEVSWLRWLYIMILSGLGTALAFFLGFYLAARPSPRPEGELEEFPRDIKIGRGKIPLLLILLFIGIGIYMIVYLLYVSLAGVSY